MPHLIIDNYHMVDVACYRTLSLKFTLAIYRYSSVQIELL